MSKIKYHYNSETCSFEPLIPSRGKVITNILAFLCVSLIMAVGLIYLYQQNFTPYKEAQLREKNETLQMEWDHLNNKLVSAQGEIEQLTYKDDHVYRVILDTEPIPNTIRHGGVGGHYKFEDLVSAGLEREDLILGQYEKIDQLKKSLYIQSRSYDEINKLLKEKEVIWASRPAIQPVNNVELVRISSGFNPKRWHPILKRYKPHKGIDFTADPGTPVYATGDGVVRSAYYSGSYGNVIFLNHGYGFQTRYAHLQKFNVKRGQKVKRGEIIGYVGNTGRSEAPHLHYEVVYNYRHQNPINYFQRDLSNNEYEKLIEISNSKDEILD